MTAVQLELPWDGIPSELSHPAGPGREARRQRGRVAQLAGTAAEDAVATRYARHGLQVAARNWRGGGAEIDLILRDGRRLIIVEVKRGESFARAIGHFSTAQFERIARAAQVFAETEPNGSLTEIRFDLALVDGTGRISVEENFWP